MKKLVAPDTEVIVGDPPRRRARGRPFIGSWALDGTTLTLSPGPRANPWPSDAFDYDYSLPSFDVAGALFGITHDEIPNPRFDGLTRGRAYNAFIRGRYPCNRH